MTWIHSTSDEKMQCVRLVLQLYEVLNFEFQHAYPCTIYPRCVSS